MIKRTIIYCFALLLMACEDEQVNRGEYVPPYFQLDSFVLLQDSLLQDYGLTKSVQLNEKKEDVKLTPQNVDWLGELDFFSKADINSPALATAYLEEIKGDSTVYTLKKGEKNKVKTLAVRFFDDKRPRSISFVMENDNIFYQSKTKGDMQIDANTGLVSAYQISGNQKVVFLSPIEMKVEATVTKD
ncbi:hypothetical protein MM239_00105 [Belliella sp. DSM 111904]|uniref:Uncharacterized protein n=1 Tax=Belliella filtrata TaxID=2923435 RepID=A0ABS9UUD4_9BACT|nr:hypothetical protein [Belliella filtrata]MCH7407780.1 hypothetical protein [Belliella filtrata]